MTNNPSDKPTPPGTGLFQSKFAASVPALQPSAQRAAGAPTVPANAVGNSRSFTPTTGQQNAKPLQQQQGYQNGGVNRTAAAPSAVSPPPQQVPQQQPFVFRPFQQPPPPSGQSQPHQVPMQPMQPATNNATPIFAPSAAPVMNERMFEEYRQYIYKLTGILFTETKKYLLEGRIAKRLAVHGIKTFEQYLDFIKNPTTAQTELPALYEAITINETYFFRSEQQVDAMEKVLIPEILRKKVNPGLFKIWSAASSTGEEAYTMAMVIQEKLKPLFPNTQFQIIGTDINNAVIESARKGIYREYAVRNVPPQYMQKYFVKSGDFYHLSDTIRRMVQFNYLNLYDTPAMRQMQSFDVIFCCNVLIYFDLASKQQVVSSLYDSLNKGGYLFIGYSESLHGISKAFELVHLPKALAYQKL